MEMVNRTDKEFKGMVIKMLTNLGKRMNAKVKIPAKR